MLLFFLAALLPGLYWDQGTQSASQLKQASVTRLYVPAGQQSEWKKQGFSAEPFDAARYVKATTPGVEYRMDVASATRVPWLDANGWRFLRDTSRPYYYDVPASQAGLAAAEAYSYGADAVVHCAAGDLGDFGRMLEFLRSVDAPAMPVVANIGIVDDGSETTGEVLNLLVRRNLLVRAVKAEDPKLDLNVRIGSAEYPKAAAEDPYGFSQTVRQQLGDQKRLLRIYGSEVVIAHLTGDGAKMRVHLLNYGRGKVQGLRVRVLGTYAHGTIHASGVQNPTLSDYGQVEGGTEFSIPEFRTYAVVDLQN